MNSIHSSLEPSISAQFSHCQVLLADDSLAIQKVMKLALDGHYELKVVNSMSQIIGLLNQHSYELLICDGTIAGSSTATKLSQIKQQFPSMQILILKGSFDHHFFDQADGFDHVLSKPFSRADVVKAVRSLIPDSIMSITEPFAGADSLRGDHPKYARLCGASAQSSLSNLVPSLENETEDSDSADQRDYPKPGGAGLSSVELDLVVAEVSSRLSQQIGTEIRKQLEQLVADDIQKNIQCLIREELTRIADQRSRY